MTYRHFKQGALLLSVFLITGCTQSWYEPTLYNWGAYNSAMHDQAIDPTTFSPSEAIQDLSSAVNSADARYVPPGMCLHLAYLMGQSGLDTEARALIKKEAEMYPESSVWTKRLLSPPKSSRSKSS